MTRRLLFLAAVSSGDDAAAPWKTDAENDSNRRRRRQRPTAGGRVNGVEKPGVLLFIGQAGIKDNIYTVSAISYRVLSQDITRIMASLGDD